MKWLFFAIGFVAALAVLLTVVGLLRPRDHVAAGEVVYEADIDTVWSVIADLESWPAWNPEVESVRRSPDDPEVWLVTGGWGELPTRIVASDPPRRLVTSVEAEGFGGTWTYDLEMVQGGTLLRVTEAGSVGNPLLRGLMVFHDVHASMRAFAAALGTRLGDEAELVEK